MMKKLLWALVGIVIVLPVAGVLVGTKVMQFQAMAEAGAAFQMPPEAVNVADVREEFWQPRVSAVGSVVAVQGTVISSEMEGIVRSIQFESGATVQAGDVLVQLDVDVEQAQLHSAQVDADWARVSLKRAQELSKTRNISEVELDSAANQVKQADAQVAYYQALIAKKTIRAPFTGKAGIRQISVGQFLTKGNPVVSLQAMDPVYVEFSLPQQRLGELSEGLAVAVTSDSYPKELFPGVITAVNPDVDPATRNVRVQATLNNPQSRLRPGMFVALDVILERSEKVLLIPATAVVHGPTGDSVFVVEEGEADAEGKRPLALRQQPVRLGARYGDFVVASEGLKVGERVVSTGVFKLRPGMSVVIDNSLAPAFSLAPTPTNS